ncbi:MULTISPECIES: hypothetical protein [Falsihalocynthiibacter]|uniref:hypothetical protein n=1 Tax=Falsihalocynthiibacter TaxID=2854182 RepID=UPI00300113CB
MFVSANWRFILKTGALSLLLMAACSGGRNDVPGSGPLANELQIARMLSGNSFDTHANGQIYQARNGGLLSFSYHPEGPRVCKGVWKVDGAEEINVLTCKWVWNGQLYSQKEKVVRYQYHIGSVYGLDMLDEAGEFVAFLPYKYGTTYGSTKYRGFPRWEDFKKLSQQLGL